MDKTISDAPPQMDNAEASAWVHGWYDGFEDGKKEQLRVNEAALTNLVRDHRVSRRPDLDVADVLDMVRSVYGPAPLALRDATDDEIQKELVRRRDNERAAYDRERKPLFAEVNIENYLKANARDLDRPFFKPFQQWYRDNHAGKRGMSYNGGGSYWADNEMGIAIQISLYRDVPLKEQLGILDFLPHIVPASVHIRNLKYERIEVVAKRIDIFEHTLSRRGSYILYVTDTTSYVTNNDQAVAEFGKVEDALDYIRKRHFYQIKPGYDYDGEEDD